MSIILAESESDPLTDPATRLRFANMEAGAAFFAASLCIESFYFLGWFESGLNRLRKRACFWRKLGKHTSGDKSPFGDDGDCAGDESPAYRINPRLPDKPRPCAQMSFSAACEAHS